MSKYEFRGTQGQWKSNGNCVWSVNEGLVCMCSNSPHTKDYDAQAIAAVPELIDVLGNLLSRVGNDADAKKWFVDEQREARTALAKATGTELERTGGSHE